MASSPKVSARKIPRLLEAFANRTVEDYPRPSNGRSFRKKFNRSLFSLASAISILC